MQHQHRQKIRCRSLGFERHLRWNRGCNIITSLLFVVTGLVREALALKQRMQPYFFLNCHSYLSVSEGLAMKQRMQQGRAWERNEINAWVSEALALKQRMQQKIQSYDPAAPNQLSETLAWNRGCNWWIPFYILLLCHRLRGTCDETEDATTICIRNRFITSLVSEGLAMKQRMQPRSLMYSFKSIFVSEAFALKQRMQR